MVVGRLFARDFWLSLAEMSGSFSGNAFLGVGWLASGIHWLIQQRLAGYCLESHRPSTVSRLAFGSGVLPAFNIFRFQSISLALLCRVLITFHSRDQTAYFSDLPLFKGLVSFSSL